MCVVVFVVDDCCLSFSQGHKYIVVAEVLHKSWALDNSQMAFVHTLRDLERNEMKGTHTSYS